MTTIGANLQAILGRVDRASGGRAVSLVAVSKGQSIASIREAYSAGQRAFGESYVQEALTKIGQLKDLALEWHFIGPIQSNKTHAIAERFDWVQSLDRYKIAQRLDEARPSDRVPLNVCLQVNLGNEQTKHGIVAAEVAHLARMLVQVPRLRLRGLMTIPEPEAALARQRFTQLKTMFDQLNANGFALDTLSMGMSDDFETAIACGSTMVRIGTALFGPRQGKQAASL